MHSSVFLSGHRRSPSRFSAGSTSSGCRALQPIPITGTGTTIAGTREPGSMPRSITVPGRRYHLGSFFRRSCSTALPPLSSPTARTSFGGGAISGRGINFTIPSGGVGITLTFMTLMTGAGVPFPVSATIPTFGDVAEVRACTPFLHRAIPTTAVALLQAIPTSSKGSIDIVPI